jgi:hypothetical protein
VTAVNSQPQYETPLVRSAGIIIWLGAGAVLWSMSAHTSRGAVVLGRYSPAYALGIFILLAAFVSVGLALIWRWQWWSKIIVAGLDQALVWRVPFLLAAGTLALTWLLRFGAARFGWLDQAPMQGGLVAIYGGFVLLLYGAGDLLAQTDTARLDRQIRAARIVLASLLVAALADLALQSLGWRPSIIQAVGVAFVLIGLIGGAVSLQRIWSAVRPRAQLQVGLASVAILGYILVVYSPGLQHGPFGIDEQLLLSFVYRQSPWIGFLTLAPRYGALYRPLFAAQAWLLYAVFGVNYSAYYLVQLAVLALSCILVYLCILAISHSSLAGLLAALLFSSHAFVSDLVAGWAFDTAPLTALVAVAIVIWLWKWSDRWQAYLALFALLLLAPLSRENGIAITAAVMLYIVFAAATRHLPRRQAAWMLVVCLLSVGLYAALRYAGNPGFKVDLAAVGQESGILHRFYSADEINAFSTGQRLGLFGYTALANLTANFVPVFGPVGMLWAGQMSAWVIAPAVMVGLAVVIGLDRPFSQHWLKGTSNSKRWMLMALTLVLAGLSIAEAAYTASPQAADLAGLAALQFALQTALSLGIAAGATTIRRWSPAHRAVAILAVGLIVAGSLVAFPYFRYRTQYVSLFGWLLLLAIVVYYLRDGTWHRHLRSSMLVIATVLVVVNAARLYTSLPLPYLLSSNFNYQGFMCEPQFPAPIAQDIAARYHLSWPDLQACRAHGPS